MGITLNCAGALICKFIKLFERNSTQYYKTFMRLLTERKASLIQSVNISLGYKLVRRVHRKNGHSYVHRVYAEVGYELRHGAAAADIDCAELARLPIYSVILENVANPAHKFGGSVVRGRLAARARVLGNRRAAVDKRSVTFFESRSVRRVVSRGDVRGNALGIISDLDRVDLERVGNSIDNVRNYFGLHTRVADAANLFFVRKHGDNGVRAVAVENCFHFGISADLVVVTVRRD